MTNFWDQIFNFALTTATDVGQQLILDFGTVQAAEKADGSLVTQSDQWADQEIRTRIANTFPDHGVISEEAEHIFPNTDWCWVIDPLDGTTNFARGIPIWGISLGLLYQGTPVFGLIHLPPLQQTFHGFWFGSSGLTGPAGAFLNCKPIHASSDALSSNHFFNLCSRSIAIAPHLPCKIRMLGMAAYNFLTVAVGATLGGVEATPKIWDIAGSWVIVKAAGAVWYPLSTEPFPLEIGRNYGTQSYPTLVVSQAELLSVFQPLANDFINKKKLKVGCVSDRLRTL
ncbi:Inositol monophosphate family protein [Planktothrix sp. PCC 11201]|uniref:inositol monophosphatase family protein n=1 Tax=Planktothrix sp. PCC 11201 TaxID=1729650 RepID=UPI0009165E52|nr:inositol monophosphatase family protein [Planktothrix sp. PCC 11201]SKB11225.1 Inositol monophosphate family protein [Planktothrix sp. PCC 11201]